MTDTQQDLLTRLESYMNDVIAGKSVDVSLPKRKDPKDEEILKLCVNVLCYTTLIKNDIPMDEIWVLATRVTERGGHGEPSFNYTAVATHMGFFLSKEDANKAKAKLKGDYQFSVFEPMRIRQSAV